VAEAVFSALPGEKRLMDIGEEIPAGPFDLVFLGFPVMQFGVPRPVRNFPGSLPGGTPTALFITHAMFEDPGQQVMLTRELEKCRSVVAEENLAGFFHCRGELSPAVAEELRLTGIPMLQGFAGLQPITAGHPDAEELEAARQWARELAGSRRGG